MAIAVVSALAQFFDNSGDPLNGGTVTVQDAGTTSSRNIYTDTSLSTAATNPIPLDSAGRPTQGMIYTAATAYKLILKNSAGTTIRTSDNIDPGVPIGSGYLAIANGGTGATSAGTALSNLGGATAAELADLAADVAALAGAASSTEKTQIAVGTTAQRPASPAAGHIRTNSSTSKIEGVRTGTTFENFVTEANSASTANVAAESSSELYAKPSVMKYHPGIAKAWAYFTVSGGTPTMGDSWGFSSSVTDNNTGDFTLTLSTAMGSTNYAVFALAEHGSTTFRSPKVVSKTTTAINLLIQNDSGSATDPEAVSVVVFGDL